MKSFLYNLSVGLAVLAITPSPAHAIDCDGRLSGQEETICENPDLRRMDYQLNRMYQDARRQLGNPGRLVARQRAWVSDRRNCGEDFFCLRRAYSRRMGELQRLAY